jgi:hypothetical protein
MYQTPDRHQGVEDITYCTPFPLELNLTAGEGFRDFEIHVGSWKTFVYFSPEDLHKPWTPPKPPKGLPEMICILANPLEPTPQESVNALLRRFIEYHYAIGFTRIVQYAQVRSCPFRSPAICI